MQLDRGRLGFGNGARAPYACDSARSRGRLHPEKASLTRSEFQRDRDRIIHSTAFRRLKHKTQVFVAHEGDHYRTRLTHTIEVAQIARALARALRLDEDLAEGVALVHDFGHTPFGHTGEDVLNALLSDDGGFDHNAQSLAIVTRLEARYAAYDGLNLTWETLEGLVKHNGPLLSADGTALSGKPVPAPIRDYNLQQDLWLSSHASLEAQAAAIADDIAYDTHDIDDGLRSGLLSVEMLEDLPLLSGFIRSVRDAYPGLEEARLVHEITRRQITVMVEDVIATALANLDEVRPDSADAVRHAGRPLIQFSEAMAAAEKEIKDFLYTNLYRHPDVMRVRAQASAIVEDLFHAYMQDPGLMGEARQAPDAKRLSAQSRRRLVCDYLAGMTDTYALAAHRRLFDHTPDLR
ncbi:deoxyguanosinetriphosphate triphosphohydrolase [Pseudohoeflea coraliihabitans]|uniref:Deoxyguanosinetriphosphate triphosphohydrolase-like protein n=1 Tax=Pseudohoeflea coraliihabitans TaxID=2860393 RepID=A0ABS6WSS0_9HYPH|nr:deoxyguanosinetriphosphate triphosphohydrolase [Pseudohoeflea sp. DP4N28-3]MBW3098115.1 deoxyguanosinetriphosphate triphosphohydrolase [Pseudohoeflea sp. DP4N28-3]